MLKCIKPRIKQHKLISTEILFVIISLIYSSINLISKNFSAGDIFFNYLRLKEIGIDLIHLHLPSFNLYTTSVLGGATPTFYPYLLFIPISLLSLFTSGTHTIAIITAIGMLLGLNITYFSTKLIKNSCKFAFLFSLVYCSSSIIFEWLYVQGDIGAYYAIFLFPLVFIGWYQWIQYNKWKMLSIGMILEFYCHIATFSCLILVLFVLTLLFINRITLHRIFNLLKAIMMTVITTAMIWIPILFLSLTNKIYFPSQYTFSRAQRPLIFHSIKYYIAPQFCDTWGILDIVAFYLIIYYWNQLSQVEHKIVYFCILIYIINIYPIMMWLLQYTFMYHFQFLHRFIFVARYLLMFILIDIFLRIIYPRISHHNFIKIVNSVLLISLLIFCWGVIVQNGMNQHVIERQYIPYKYVNSSYKSHKLITNELHLRKYSIYNNQVHSYYNNHNLPLIYPDYYPIAISNIRSGDGRHLRAFKIPPQFKEYTDKNELLYKSPNNNYHRINLVEYNNQRYTLFNNNRRAIYKIVNHMVFIKMHKGMNKVKVNIPIMWYRKLSIIITTFGILLFSIIFERRNKNVSKINSKIKSK